MKYLHMIAFALLVIGGLNWGLFGFTGYEVGMWIGGPNGMNELLPRILYVLIGLSAVWLIVTHKKECRVCSASAGASGASMGQGM